MGEEVMIFYSIAAVIMLLFIVIPQVSAGKMDVGTGFLAMFIILICFIAENHNDELGEEMKTKIDLTDLLKLAKANGYVKQDATLLNPLEEMANKEYVERVEKLLEEHFERKENG